jgi:hypothetical protein
MKTKGFQWSQAMWPMWKRISQVGKGLPESRRIELEWLSVYRSWAHLDGYVRSRRHECGLVDMPSETDSLIRINVIQPTNPLREFSDIHDQKHTFMDHPGFIDLIGYFGNIQSASSQATLFKILSVETSGLYTLQPWDYGNAARNAEMFLTELRREVENADCQRGWLTKPRSTGRFLV